MSIPGAASPLFLERLLLMRRSRLIAACVLTQQIRLILIAPRHLQVTARRGL